MKTKEWKNKIVGNGFVDPKILVPNPENWRLHPDQQKQTVDDILGEVGWVQQIIVNKKSGKIVDGHMRVALALERGEKEIPVCYVELDEQDEKKILATLDPLSKMCEADFESYEKLTEGMETDSLLIRELLKNTGQEILEDEEDTGDVASVDKEIPEMELQPFEHYDYIVMMFKNDQDFAKACELLEIKTVKFSLPEGKQKIGTGRVINGNRVLEKLCK